MNIYSVTRYAKEVLAAASTDKVVINCGQLRELIKAAERSPRWLRDRAIFKAGVGGATERQS